VDESDQTVTIRQISADDAPARSWADHRLTDAEAGPAADAAAGLASLSFITAAIRRRTWLWCLAAVCGLLLGAGLYIVHPPKYEATTQVILSFGPNEDLTTSMATDAALAASRPVAGAALQKLGLHQSVSAFLGSYTAVPLTNRIMTITSHASSSRLALSEANAVTSAFLQYRAKELRQYEQLVTTSLGQQVAQSKAQVASLKKQIAVVNGQTGTESTPKLRNLQSQLSRATATLASVQQSAQINQQGTQVATNTAVRASSSLGPAAPVVHSRTKTAVIYVLSGLIGGLMIGVGFIAIQVLLSDRVRRRDDIALALGAPVRLSMRRIRLRRLLPGHHGISAAQLPAIQRVANHLRGVLPSDPAGAALVLVPAGRPETAALAIVALAQACARENGSVILSDLYPGAPAARLLKVRKPGVHQVDAAGSSLVVSVPARDVTAPVGPLKAATAPRQFAPPDPDLAAAYSATSVVLTLAGADPMLGADHLVTWARDAVVMVTAGESSWTRIQAVGEMVRIAGTRLVSAILIGADKTDESLGQTYTSRTERQKILPGRDDYPSAEDFFARANGSPAGAPVLPYDD
jgi:capsular polysaccharide biosynthesis protein